MKAKKRHARLGHYVGAIMSFIEEESELSEMTDPEIVAVESQLQIAIALLRGFRNTRLPIHRLPPELLALVMSFTQNSVPNFCPWIDTDPKHRPPTQEWQSVLHVCRRWRGIGARSPSLWSVVTSICKPELFLKRSGEAPLTIHITPDTPPPSDTLLPALALHSRRFRHFHCSRELSPSEFAIFSEPAPHLQSLSMMIPGKDFPAGVMPPLFGDQMPKLRLLTLKYFTSWPKDYFINLTRICIYEQQEFTRPSTSSFLDFLESSPLLEVLSMLRAGPTRDNEADNPATPISRIISLPHLKELNIGDWPSCMTVGRFLSHIQVPAQTEVYIWGQSLLNPEEDLSHLLPHDTSNLANMKNIREFTLLRQPWLSVGIPPFVAFTTTLLPPKSPAGDVNEPTLATPLPPRYATHLHIHGSHTPTQILPVVTRYDLSQVRKWRIHDNFVQSIDTMPIGVFRDFFERMRELRALEIGCDLNSPGFTRAVVGALYPSTTASSSSTLLPLSGTDSAGPSRGRSPSGFRVETPPPSSSPQSPPRLLCPKLRHIFISNDPKLPTLHINALAAERKRLGSPLKGLYISYEDMNPPKPSPYESPMLSPFIQPPAPQVLPPIGLGAGVPPPQAQAPPPLLPINIPIFAQPLPPAPPPVPPPLNLNSNTPLPFPHPPNAVINANPNLIVPPVIAGTDVTHTPEEDYVDDGYFTPEDAQFLKIHIKTVSFRDRVPRKPSGAFLDEDWGSPLFKYVRRAGLVVIGP